MRDQVLRNNLIAQYGLQIAQYVIPFLTLPYLARVLGPDGYSVRAYVLSLSTLIQVFLDFGFLQYGTKLISEANKEGTSLDGVVSLVVKAKTIILLPISVVSIAFAVFLPIIKSNATYATFAYMAMVMTSLIPDYYYMGVEKMRLLTIRYVITRGIGLVLIFTLVQSGEDLIVVALIDLAVAAFALVMTILDLKGNHRIKLIVYGSAKIVEHIKRASTYLISNASCTINASIAMVAIGYYVSDPLVVSSWSLALTVISAMQALFNPVANSLYPRMLATKDFSIVRKILTWSIPVMIILSIAVSSLSSLLFYILGGEEYVGMAWVLSLLVPMLFCSFYGIMLGFPVLGAAGKIKQMTVSSVAASVLQVTGLFTLLSLGWFSLFSVCLLRNATEFTLTVLRLIFCYKYIAS
ncbi:oligosaccharide flippase family protein [Adlercreutzia sp. ZJ138]|uniref:oligosaccharide flippase family protein n=1 Tax=Adlercreutzia sp. ZJ138 TaxID=2709405 RepID=UPI0013EBF5C0|nr:oligosaccharide flippase family protein [Adlercreutzia sp. ZJ138]